MKATVRTLAILWEDLTNSLDYSAVIFSQYLYVTWPWTPVTSFIPQ